MQSNNLSVSDVSTSVANPKVFKPNINVQRVISSNKFSARSNSPPYNTSNRNFKKRVDRSVINYLNEVILVQEILYALNTNFQSQVRQDFLYGTNQAPKLSDSELEILNGIHKLITCGRRFETTRNFITNLDRTDEAHKKATRTFTYLLEGAHEKAAGFNFTYFQARNILQRIIKSGYFNRLQTSYTEKRIEVKIGQETRLVVTAPLNISLQDSLSQATTESSEKPISATEINNNAVHIKHVMLNSASMN